MSHHTFIATEPTYWLAFDGTIEKGNYGFLSTGFVLDTDQNVLETFTTEQGLADRIDEVKGTTGWYYLPENRIPSPPRPA
ncbi:MAG: hypothetical protein ACO23H_18165 [Alphaproteobacteria bacterium]